MRFPSLRSAAVRRPWIALIVLALAAALVACSDDDDSADKDTSRTTTDEIRRSGKTPNPKEVAAARQERADERVKQREEEELEDKEFDEAFEETPFDRLVDKLPLRKPPLHVAQYISGDGHKIYAAVSRQRFCGLSADRRKRAVSSYFESADRTFREGKIDDLEVVVTPVTEKLDELPALATASGDTVKLAPGGC